MPPEISPRELAAHIENGHAVHLVDVRQPWENQLARLPGSVLIPLNELPPRAGEIPTDPAVTVVVYCHHGVRSLTGAHLLQLAGVGPVASLAGGIDAWSRLIDPTMPRY